jgi:putative restriction endonuclease
MDRRYPDEEPVELEGNGWAYRYFQENLDLAARDSEYANAGLLGCIRDRVPVGVLRQVAKKPKPRYSVLGVAFVREWKDGYFYLESAS